MIITTVIVDDSLEDIIKLVSLLMSNKTNQYECKYFENPKDEEILSGNADLYFLDIDMPETSGFERARKINKFNPKAIIIFYSQHEDLVFEAFKLNFQYFIRKSKMENDFMFAIKKIEKLFIASSSYLYMYKDIKEVFPLSEIAYFSSNHNSSHLFLTNGMMLNQRKSMFKIENEVIGKQFLRIHVSYLVNISYIRHIKGSSVVLKSGKELPISRNRTKNTLSKFRNYRLER